VIIIYLLFAFFHLFFWNPTSGYYSFERKGDIKRFNKSKKYVPGFMEIERIKEESLKIGEERGTAILILTNIRANTRRLSQN
jgi:hypothetical protein